MPAITRRQSGLQNSETPGSAFCALRFASAAVSVPECSVGPWEARVAGERFSRPTIPKLLGGQ